MPKSQVVRSICIDTGIHRLQAQVKSLLHGYLCSDKRDRTRNIRDLRHSSSMKGKKQQQLSKKEQAQKYLHICSINPTP